MEISKNFLESIRDSILESCKSGAEGSSALAEIAQKIEAGTATYAEVYQAARAHGNILAKALETYLPNALTDEKITIEAAEELIRQPMISSAGEVGKIARKVQKKLNENAGIGLDYIEPKTNLDQINGIIQGICQAESYESGSSVFRDRVENFLEGYVDDCVRENAGFQYRAGLSPKIERKPVPNCCAWCSRLAGVYDYAQVSNTGNDVFRRHRNCHCQVLYSPDGSKRRQNVHSKEWTKENKADRIRFAESTDDGFAPERLKMNLQLHARKSGEYRRAMYGSEWQEASLKGAIEEFVRGAKPIRSQDNTKIRYSGKDGRYEIVYDRKGDYFRILNRQSESKNKPYVGKDGKQVLSITENGKTRNATNDEYERLTHFKNSDRKGGK